MISEPEKQKNKVNIQHALFYSQITLAMNAVRVIKSLGLNRNYNRTEREIIAFAQLALIVSSAKIWDKSNYNIRKFVNRIDIDEKERQNLKGAVGVLENKYEKTIVHVLKWRHELVAHLDKELNTIKKFNEFDGSDIADIQKMLKEVSELVCSVSWYPPQNRPMQFLNYSQIESDLRI